MSKISITIAEACELSGLSRSTIYNLIQSGDLTKRKVGTRTLILVKELEDYLTSLPSEAA